MKKMITKEIIIDNDGFPRIGYHICNVYIKKDNNVGEFFNYNEDTIELYGFGYCPHTKKIYFNKLIKLPKRIVKYFNGAPYTKENIELLESLGVFDYYDNRISNFEKQLEDYQANEIKVEVEKFKEKESQRLLKIDYKD